MAFLTECKCTECGGKFDYYYRERQCVPPLCIDCQNKKDKDGKKGHFEALDLMSLEKRVRILEEELYDRNLMERRSKSNTNYSSFQMG